MSDLVKLQRSASNKSLLYIDGDTQLQRNYGIYFQKSFQNFYQAFDGEEGLSKFEKYRPDVVILNLELEKKDAIELISEIHDIDENVILISISEECENYDLLQTLDMGLNKMFLKPVGFAQIAQSLIELLPPPPPPAKPKPKPVVKKQEPIKEIKKTPPKVEVKPTPKVTPKELPKQEPPKLKKTEPVKQAPPPPKPVVKNDLEICLDLIRELAAKKTLLEFINSYKGVMVLHDGIIASVEENSFSIKVNVAQILAAKSEKQILIKTFDHQYIHAQLIGIDLQNTMLKLANPRILKYKQRDKEFSRILADQSFKASVYYKKKHVDFSVSYISFRSAVLLTHDKEINFNQGDIIDITLGFNISGPNAMIKDKQFTKVFAKCEVIRVEDKKDVRQIVILLNVNKSGERTLRKYLTDRESELIYEFKSRVRR